MARVDQPGRRADRHDRRGDGEQGVAAGRAAAFTVSGTASYAGARHSSIPFSGTAVRPFR
ncbi:hypothetical protein V6574_04605 [Streptomyces sp. SM1P]